MADHAVLSDRASPQEGCDNRGRFRREDRIDRGDHGRAFLVARFAPARDIYALGARGPGKGANVRPFQVPERQDQ